MADIKWIKITTDIFDDEKILLIENMPDADAIIVIWFKLLCLAGKQNNSGVFMMNDKIAYTDSMLATIFRRKETTVKMALEIFEQFGMIEIVDGVITIPNWGKHQNLDKIEQKTEYMRNYMREYREKQKEIACKTNSKTNSKSNVSEADKIRLDKEEELEEEKENKVSSFHSDTSSDKKSDFDIIAEKWNELNKFGIVSIRKISSDGKRATLLRARLKEYSLEEVVYAIDKIKQSDFLQGKHNGKPWQITFDWFILPSNFPKVLEGNYDNKGTFVNGNIPDGARRFLESE